MGAVPEYMYMGLIRQVTLLQAVLKGYSGIMKADEEQNRTGE